MARNAHEARIVHSGCVYDQSFNIVLGRIYRCNPCRRATSAIDASNQALVHMRLNACRTREWLNMGSSLYRFGSMYVCVDLTTFIELKDRNTKKDTHETTPRAVAIRLFDV